MEELKISVHDFGHAQTGDAILKRGQLKDVARAALLVRTEEKKRRGERKEGKKKEKLRGGVF